MSHFSLVHQPLKRKLYGYFTDSIHLIPTQPNPLLSQRQGARTFFKNDQIRILEIGHLLDPTRLTDINELRDFIPPAEWKLIEGNEFHEINETRPWTQVYKPYIALNPAGNVKGYLLGGKTENLRVPQEYEILQQTALGDVLKLLQRVWLRHVDPKDERLWRGLGIGATITFPDHKELAFPQFLDNLLERFPEPLIEDPPYEPFEYIG